MFTRSQVVNMKIVMEPLRNSKETLSTQNLIILGNFQYWTKFLVSYKKYVYFKFSHKGFYLCPPNVQKKDPKLQFFTKAVLPLSGKFLKMRAEFQIAHQSDRTIVGQSVLGYLYFHIYIPAFENSNRSKLPVLGTKIVCDA